MPAATTDIRFCFRFWIRTPRLIFCNHRERLFNNRLILRYHCEFNPTYQNIFRCGSGSCRCHGGRYSKLGLIFCYDGGNCRRGCGTIPDSSFISRCRSGKCRRDGGTLFCSFSICRDDSGR